MTIVLAVQEYLKCSRRSNKVEVFSDLDYLDFNVRCQNSFWHNDPKLYNGLSQQFLNLLVIFANYLKSH